MDPRVPAQGARTYSVGHALDVGLTITEGVANGLVEDSFTPRIHYSGALNAGMSGGPALDARGSVVGVNVSHYYYSQLVSSSCQPRRLSSSCSTARVSPSTKKPSKRRLRNSSGLTPKASSRDSRASYQLSRPPAITCHAS